MKKIKNCLLFVFSMFICTNSFSFDISSKLEKDLVLQGYESTSELAEMTYHSSIPGATKALIVRGSSTTPISWFTQKTPASIKEDYVSFVWLSGVGCNLGESNFHMSINGELAFHFTSNRKKQWKLTNKKGMELLFNTDLVDEANDYFGFMVLRLPKELVKSNQALNISIVGEKSTKAAWYMCFKEKIKSSTEIKSYPIVYKNDGERFQMLKAQMVHFGKNTSVKFEIEGEESVEQAINFGFNEIDLPVKAVTKNLTKEIRQYIDGNLVKEFSQSVKKVKSREIFMVQHVHTDIGYTRPQTEILPEHLRYIDYALDYCDATDDYPEEAKFKWTCETTWAVAEYLKVRPKSQIERLKKRIKEGRISVTGMMFNFSEALDENLLVASLKPLKEIKAKGIEVESAMQNDVNGIAWSFIDYFNSVGVKYLTMGTHAHRALLVFDTPSLFWWQAPSGKKMLTMRGDHYMLGTTWGLTGHDMSKVETQMAAHIQELEKNNYAYDELLLQYSGYHTDNSPPSTFSCDNIKAWNEKYETPKLRNATSIEFMKFMEKKYANKISTYKAAWPDWWTDGAASAPRELAAARQTQSDLIANKGALAMARVKGSEVEDQIFESIDELNENLLFYSEHTYGASESVREPYVENSIVQRKEKEAYAWTAVKQSRMIKEYALGKLQSYIPKTTSPQVAVFNTLGYKRSAYHTLYIDNEILPVGKKFKFVDEKGNELNANLGKSRADGNYWTVFFKDIPAFGYKNFKILVSKEDADSKTSGTPTNLMENQYYKIILDRKTGAISSIFDKELNQELVDSSNKWKFGQLINEKLGSRSQMEAYTLIDYKRETTHNFEISNLKEKPSYQYVTVKSQSNTLMSPSGVLMEVRLYKDSKLIELKYKALKKPIVDPEGLYVSLPFKMENFKLSYQAQGGVVTPGKNQLPGSSTEWFTVQDYVTISNSKAKVLVSCEEIPLMTFGGMINKSFKKIAKVEKPHIYSFVYNNYWVTNFNAEFAGELNWTYKITSSKPENIQDQQFASNARIPLLTRIIPKSTKASNLVSESLISNIPNNISIVSTQPVKGENALFMHLRENEGKEIELALKFHGAKVKAIVNTDVLGRKINSNLHVYKYDNKFVKIIFE